MKEDLNYEMLLLQSQLAKALEVNHQLIADKIVNEKLVGIPEHLFDDLVEYMSNIADADGDSEGYHPNREMVLLNELQNCKQ